MRITDQLAHAREDIDRFEIELPNLLRRLRDAMPGQPGAASYEARVTHDHSDATFEAAATLYEGKSPAANDRAELERRIGRIAHEADALIRLARSWQSRGPTDKERRETASANVPGCELHAKVGVFADRESRSQTFGDFATEAPLDVCVDCRNRIRATRRVPSTPDLEHHRDHHKWPRMLETNYQGGAVA